MTDAVPGTAVRGGSDFRGNEIRENSRLCHTGLYIQPLQSTVGRHQHRAQPCAAGAENVGVQGIAHHQEPGNWYVGQFGFGCIESIVEGFAKENCLKPDRIRQVMGIMPWLQRKTVLSGRNQIRISHPDRPGPTTKTVDQPLLQAVIPALGAEHQDGIGVIKPFAVSLYILIGNDKTATG